MAANSNNQSQSRRTRSKSSNSPSHPSCEDSLFAAVDVVMLLLVLGALGILALPYFKFLFQEASELLPVTYDLIGEAICDDPVVFVAAFVLIFGAAIAVWEIVDHRSRKCGNPHCRGLGKAAEFDIQLETEEHVKRLPPALEEEFGTRPLHLGDKHKKVEAELKKMAPANGRTVLILRAPCGCVEGKMEVWGPKKVRKIKK